MMRKSASGAAGMFVAALAMIACGNPQDTRTKDDEVRARLDAIEERLGSVEKRIESLSDLTAGRKDVPSSQAAGEGRQEEGPAPSPKGGPDTGLSRLSGPQGEQVHAASVALSDEYRARRKNIEAQFGAGTAERQQSLRDLNEWYRSRLREIVGREGSSTQDQRGR